MICPNCGSEIENNGAVCPNCGAANEPAEASSPAAEAPAEAVIPETPAPAEATSDDVSVPTEVVSDDAVTAEPVYTEPAFTVAPVEPVVPQKKKGTKIALAILIPVAVIAVAAVLCLTVFSNLIMNAFASPVDYYKHVEKDGSEELAENISSIYNDYIKVYGEDIALDSEITVELSDSAVTLIESAVGMDLSWLENINIKIDEDIVDSVIQLNTDILHGDTSIVGMKMIFDQIGQKYLVSLPGLTDKYAEIDLAEMGTSLNIDDYINIMPSEKVLNDLLDRYLAIVVNNISKVERSSDTLEIGGISRKCTVLTAQIDEDTLYNIVVDILDTAKTDKDLKPIIEDFAAVYAEQMRSQYNSMVELLNEEDMDYPIEDYLGTVEDYIGFDPENVYEEFVTAIDDTLDSIEKTDFEGETYFLKNYVNSDGDIVARMLKSSSEMLVFFGELQNKNNCASELNIADGSFVISGEGTVKGEARSVVYTVYAEGVEYLTIETEDLICESDKINGKITITPDMSALGLSEMMEIFDLAIAIELDSDGNKANMKLDVLNADDSLVSITVDSQIRKPEAIDMPEEADILSGEDGLYEWIETLDSEKLLDNLRTSGIPEEIIVLIQEAFTESDSDNLASDEYYDDEYLYEDIYDLAY